jgi:O-acetyl-ADP-ribose deacetylase (regulator of RNase III)
MTGPAVVLTLAVGSLLAGVGLYLYIAARGRVEYFQSANVIAWLLVALFPVLVIFSLFPDSTFSTSVQGVSAGGAIAAFAFIWWHGTNKGLQAADEDARRRALRARDETIARLTEERDAARAAQDPKDLRETTVHRYRCQDAPGKEIRLVAGNLSRVDCADVWVNSENTNMQMASFYDRSVSGLIRYLGARRNAGGHVTEDVVGKALAAQMGESVTVSPGTVLVTESGDLAGTHRVKAIFHVAAVQGQAGAGYRQIEDIGCCVENVLREIDRRNLGGAALRSVVFPLMGAGQGRGNVTDTVRSLAVAAIDHLRSRSDTAVEQVYLLAHTDAELAACTSVLASLPRLAPVGRRQASRSG